MSLAVERSAWGLPFACHVPWVSLEVAAILEL